MFNFKNILTPNFKYLLFFKWIVFNFVGFSLFGLSIINGWPQSVYMADKSGISVIIFGLLIYSIGLSGIKVFNVSRELNLLNENKSEKLKQFKTVITNAINYAAVLTGAIALAFKEKLYAKLLLLAYIPSLLMILGLLGTVHGFIDVFMNIPVDAVGNLDAVGDLMTALTSGMGTALYTTYAGAVASIWSRLNHIILLTGTAFLSSEIIEKTVDEDFNLDAFGIDKE